MKAKLWGIITYITTTYIYSIYLNFLLRQIAGSHRATTSDANK
jgi:hypothetical protein